MCRLYPFFVAISLVALVCCFSPTPASGQANTPIPNMDLKHFDAVPGPYALWGVHTARGLGHLGIFAGLLNNYANDLLVIRGANGYISRPIQHRMTSDIALALGLFRWIEVGVSLPIFWRQIRSNFPLGQNVVQGDTNIGDLRLSSKVMLMHNDKFKGFGLSVVLDLSLPTGGDKMLMRSSTATFTPRLILDYRHSSGFVVALNAGYRFRGRAQLLDLVVADELRFALGMEVPLFFREVSVVGELETAIGVGQLTGESKRPLSADSPTELRLGIRWRHAPSGLMLGLGAGVGLSQGYGAPDLRILFSLGWSFDLAKRKPILPFRNKVRVAQATPASRPNLPPPPKLTGVPKTVVRPPPKARVGTLPSLSTAAPALSTAVWSTMVKEANKKDADGDGIPVPQDKCPLKAEDFDHFEDSDGCPDPDNDRDGIPDTRDKCPKQKEIYNGVKDDDGCPDKGKSKIVWKRGTNSSGKIQINEKIFFNSGSDKIKRRSLPLLRQLAGFLKSNWLIREVQIEGHTDSRGDPEMNVDLSERRARRVMSVLVRLGVAQVRLQAKGFGSRKPVASNSSRKGRAANRRVVFKVLKVLDAKNRKGGIR